MMQITITLNGTKISPEIEPDTLLIDLVPVSYTHLPSL